MSFERLPETRKAKAALRRIVVEAREMHQRYPFTKTTSSAKNGSSDAASYEPRGGAATVGGGGDEPRALIPAPPPSKPCTCRWHARCLNCIERDGLTRTRLGGAARNAST